ncbi:hypothetical protein SAM23877_5880 [Streptomyces ambofaciens ATCC 23877]|uniref:Uncharacterized protein n=1 Tax=Streptomyces ambofaciens (strain ATCC 23877 / 3486 / DSM 40053 / JCM 4204 / NBRC 12836 / NRRL B-2516) TaxID=278992 RepID=A0A0K2B0M2_STRA7|nr:hypothetical protein SAM23877_5880 [Streptomyces ambofaciens ATCC 23877]
MLRRPLERKKPCPEQVRKARQPSAGLAFCGRTERNSRRLQIHRRRPSNTTVSPPITAPTIRPTIQIGSILKHPSMCDAASAEYF